MERDFNLLRELALLNRKYHIGLIKYHCDLLRQAHKEVVKTIKNKKKWERIKKLKKKNKTFPLSFCVNFVTYENESLIGFKENEK
jgi:hypothetical protein